MRRQQLTEAQIGAALIAAREAGQDPFEAITAVIPWERFRVSVAEAEALARPEDFDSYERLGEHYSAMRRWAPAFLASFSFQGVPAVASLLRAVDTLRTMNEAGALKQSCLPRHQPPSIIARADAASVAATANWVGVAQPSLDKMIVKQTKGSEPLLNGGIGQTRAYRRKADVSARVLRWTLGQMADEAGDVVAPGHQRVGRRGRAEREIF
jgi:hypothetical protein